MHEILELEHKFVILNRTERQIARSNAVYVLAHFNRVRMLNLPFGNQSRSNVRRLVWYSESEIQKLEIQKAPKSRHNFAVEDAQKCLKSNEKLF